MNNAFLIQFISVERDTDNKIMQNPPVENV